MKFHKLYVKQDLSLTQLRKMSFQTFLKSNQHKVCKLESSISLKNSDVYICITQVFETYRATFFYKRRYAKLGEMKPWKLGFVLT